VTAIVVIDGMSSYARNIAFVGLLVITMIGVRPPTVSAHLEELLAAE